MELNIFETAPCKLQPSKTTGREDAIPVQGIEKYTSISVLQKSLALCMATYASTIKSYMVRKFVSEILKTKKRPENFFGIEGNAIASLQLKKRSSDSPLNEDEQRALFDADIPVQVVTEFTINSKYCDLSDPRNVRRLKKVSSAIKKALGKSYPADFILRTSKQVITDATIESVCRKKSKAEVEMLLDLVTTLAIRPELIANTPDDVEKAYTQGFNCLFDDNTVTPVFNRGSLA